MRDQCSALRNSSKQQRRLADSDRLAARLRVARSILDRGLDQGPRRTLVEIPSGKVGREHEIEVIRPVSICLAFDGGRFKNLDIRARYLHG